MAPKPCQSWQQVLKLREFDLQLSFLAPGALRENIEDQRRAIQNFAAENFLEIARLRGRKFIVENNRVHFVLAALRCELVRLARADERGGERRIEFLDAIANHFAARSGRKLGQFVKRFADVNGSARLEFRSDEEDPFGSLVACGDEGFQILMSVAVVTIARIARERRGENWESFGRRV